MKPKLDTDMNYGPTPTKEMLALEQMAASIHACLQSMEQAKTMVPAGNPNPFYVMLKEYHVVLSRIASLRLKQLEHLV